MILINDEEIIKGGKKIPMRHFGERYPGGSSEGYNLTEVQRWAKKSGIKNKLIYKGQTLWYLMDYFFMWGTMKVRDAPAFSEIYSWTDSTLKIINTLKPRTVKLVLKNKFKAELMKRVFKQQGIKVVNEKKFNPVLHQYNREYFLLKGRLILRMMLKSTIENKNKACIRIIAMSSDQFSKKKNEDNYIFGDVIKELNSKNRDNELLIYDRLWAFHSWKNILNIMKKGDDTKSFFGQYYNLKTFRQMEEVRQFLKKKGKQLLLSQAFRDSCEYKGIKFFDLVENRFRFVFNAFSYEIGDCLATTQRILIVRKPDLILLDHPDNFYGKGFMINAKQHKCQVAALQYELIYPGCVATHIKEDNKKKSSPLWRPIPDISFVGGSYAKQILIEKCNYPAENIRTVGQPRYDSYFKMANKHETKKKLRNKLGIPTNKKLLVYVTAARPLYNVGRIDKLIEIVKKNKDLFLFVKVHPNGMVKKFTNFYDLNYENIMIQRDVDLRQLLPAADLLISPGSSVDIESMIFDTPVLLIQDDQIFPIPFKQYEAALFANEIEEIRTAITSILHDVKIQEKLKEGRKKFIKDYLFSRDGQTAQRIVKEL